LTIGGNGQWTEKVLHSFTNDGNDGYNPYAGLIFDAAGNLYGTTSSGGTGSGCAPWGCGTVFQLMLGANGQWSEKVLHSFTNDGNDGYSPYYGGSLIFGAAGNLYGTTFAGGTVSCGNYGCGTVFELSPSNGSWNEAVLHSFSGSISDGVLPYAGVVLDAAGNLYGTTSEGGAKNNGTVFEIVSLSLLFPVKKDQQCGDGVCTPTNAPITAVFDHYMAKAYECSAGVGGYGQMMAFTDQAAAVRYSGKGYGACKKLFGYTNPQIPQFLSGYNYTGGDVLWYDSHPGYDYDFLFGTQLYPALNGCMTYLQGAAGVQDPSTGHVLAIIPQPTRPKGGCEHAVNTSGYAVIYMHLASYYDKTTKQVMRCKKMNECVSGKIYPCPKCAQQYEWVSTNRADPIGYSGNYFNGWGGVVRHLHIEVDQVLGKRPRGVDPYGWCGSEADPYTSFTGLTNSTLWSQFWLTCPNRQ
jgi:hypothetical protein